MAQEIDIVIPTVLPQRSAELSALLSQLGGWSVRVEVHMPGAPPWARVERIFGQPRGELVVQLEDDITLAPGAINRIIAVARECWGQWALFSFFSRERHLAPGIAKCHPGRFHMTQAIALRAPAARDFAAWFPAWKASHPTLKSGIGQGLGAWARETGADILVHYPSLVQHLPVASTISRRPLNRQSPTFGGAP
jgi:hypothetical protein